MIKVAIVDDHKIVLQGLQSILLGHTTIQVIGTYLSAEAFTSEGLKKKPDVLLLDMNLPGISGSELALKLTTKSSAPGIIMLTALDDQKTIETALESGVKGFLSKEVEKDELIQAIIQVAAGEVFFGRSISTKIFEVYYTRGLKAIPKSLTPREIDVLKLIAEGNPHKIIADKLFVSIKTVEAHKFNLQQKLQLFSTAELVKYAIKKGYSEL